MDDAERYAVDNGVEIYQAAAALNSPLTKHESHWPLPATASISEAVRSSDIDLMIGDSNLLKELARSVADTVKFPINTAYLHGVGCVASAMTKAFNFEYGIECKPVNLYVVTAQPPSTGKSGVNSIFTTPILEAYEELNEANRVTRKKLIREIARAEKQLAGTKELSEYDEIELYDRLDEAETALKKTPEWTPIIDDATIEAAEDLASNQTGMWNIVSAESESISVVVGAVYGDDKKGKNSNFGLLLKSWDGEKTSTVRITRKGHNGYVRGSIAVIAQDESVETILSAGSSGRGLAERFLLLAEGSILGKRDFQEAIPLRTDLYTRYKQLIHNIVNEKFVKLRLSAECVDHIKHYRMGVEPELSDGGAYAHNLLTGFMGKADKQLIKLACIIHVIEHWQDGGSRSVEVQDDSMIQAIGLFDELAKTYINAADCMGFVGGKSEIIKASEYLEAKAQKGTLKIRVSQMVNDIKNVRPFKGTRKITEKVKSKTLPILESLNYCVVSGANIYINPRLK